jgi:hypothetical protein
VEAHPRPLSSLFSLILLVLCTSKATHLLGSNRLIGLDVDVIVRGEDGDFVIGELGAVENHPMIVSL